MTKYVITLSGDNERLHHEALAAACEAVERVNKAPIYRAWVERHDGQRWVTLPNRSNYGHHHDPNYTFPAPGYSSLTSKPEHGPEEGKVAPGESA